MKVGFLAHINRLRVWGSVADELGRGRWGTAFFYLSNALGRNLEHDSTLHNVHAVHPLASRWDINGLYSSQE